MLSGQQREYGVPSHALGDPTHRIVMHAIAASKGLTTLSEELILAMIACFRDINIQHIHTYIKTYT